MSGVTKLGNFSGNSTRSASTFKKKKKKKKKKQALLAFLFQIFLKEVPGQKSLDGNAFTIRILFLKKTYFGLKFLSQVKGVALSRGLKTEIIHEDVVRSKKLSI